MRDSTLPKSPRIRIGTAGWSNPPAKRSDRNADQSHLHYYATHFSCVEINTSFYRPHREKTYERWRDETPASFRFSVKMPRSVTHESHLKRCAREVARFYEDIAALQPKLTAVLVQLPPSLEFEGRAVRAFFKSVPRVRGAKLVCEPRHASWFTTAAEAFCVRRACPGSLRIRCAPPARTSPAGRSVSPTFAGMAHRVCIIRSIRRNSWPPLPRPSGRVRRGRSGASSTIRRATQPGTMRCNLPRSAVR